MRDTDYIAAKLLDLDNLKAHAAIEHEGSIHVRYRRRVIFVYNVDEDTFRVNEIRTNVEMKAVNRCLKIATEGTRKLTTLSAAAAPATDADGAKITRTPTFVWFHISTGDYAKGAITGFTPREDFSAINGVSLSTAAGRNSHEEARDVS